MTQEYFTAEGIGMTFTSTSCGELYKDYLVNMRVRRDDVAMDVYFSRFVSPIQRLI
jgi:hypothetical protein